MPFFSASYSYKNSVKNPKNFNNNVHRGGLPPLLQTQQTIDSLTKDLVNKWNKNNNWNNLLMTLKLIVNEIGSKFVFPFPVSFSTLVEVYAHFQCNYFLRPIFTKRNDLILE